jgi:hypothetical protein
MNSSQLGPLFSRRRVPFLAIFAVMTIVLFLPAARAQNPMVIELLEKGVETAGGKSLPLPPPLLSEGMTADQQLEAIRKVAASKGEDRFYKDSVVSPFVLDIKTVGKLDGGAQVQQIDIYFVVYGTLQEIQDKELLEEMGRSENKSDDALPEDSRALSEQDLQRAGLTAGKQEDGTTVTYGQLRANLLDKVYLELITRSQTSQNDSGLTLASRLDPELAQQTGLPSTWRSIDDVGGQVRLGTPEPYFAAAAYGQVTPILAVPGALLVEMHVLFVEPRGWFQGRNLLRSKLPPVIQDGVRKFRRKLAQ